MYSTSMHGTGYVNMNANLFYVYQPFSGSFSAAEQVAVQLLLSDHHNKH